MTSATSNARELATVLHDLAWLLPRTIDAGLLGPAAADALPPSELEVMRLLVRRPGLTVGDVARELGLQRPNVSTAIRTLIARGLLQRERDRQDGRIARLTPTARAIENRDRREQAWGEALARRLEALEADELTAILACSEPLARLVSALAAGR